MSEKNREKTFEPDQLVALAQVVRGLGYQVILDVMEGECNKAENEFLGAHPSTPQDVLAAHAILHAQRAFFQEVVRKIDLMASEMGPQQDNRRLTIEEQIDSL